MGSAGIISLMNERLGTDSRKILNFLEVARRMETTYRFTPKPDVGFENDAEHSWSVALTCMLVASRVEKELEVKLDQLKMLKMALVHDLAEVKTGDTKTWDETARADKEGRERRALTELLRRLPEDLAVEIMMLWEECEKRESPEALIVKSIDRLDPVIHRTVLGVGWENVEAEQATVEALDERQLPRHQFSEALTELYRLVRDEAVAKGFFKEKKG